jgi:hypothetical protein
MQESAIQHDSVDPLIQAARSMANRPQHTDSSNGREEVANGKSVGRNCRWRIFRRKCPPSEENHIGRASNQARLLLTAVNHKLSDLAHNFSGSLFPMDG